ncbi:PREDICTED: transcription elongation factor B polypeptide 1 isoform X1 [Dufourea novaeangliae]|uniref:transcription elongation factor B polypeptide 1 isoform X1 n=1 Tax=Dufourea novaeangliae TaxID=178035 RepID=UPI0007674FE6|nr:PREDICTED: transcription elongation factor B polypeptide 1 isoform X1 [Dufourea novaeangliae]
MPNDMNMQSEKPNEEETANNAEEEEVSSTVDLHAQESGPVYGGCEGPNAMYVKLISSDGHEFIVKREHALISGTIKAMLSGPGQFSENEANEVNFREIPSHVLQKVCMYFTYKVRYTNSSTEIPEFPIAPEIALELLMAGNFLDC